MFILFVPLSPIGPCMLNMICTQSKDANLHTSEMALRRGITNVIISKTRRLKLYSVIFNMIGTCYWNIYIYTKCPNKISISVQNTC